MRVAKCAPQTAFLFYKMKSLKKKGIQKTGEKYGEIDTLKSFAEEE